MDTQPQLGYSLVLETLRELYHTTSDVGDLVSL
jgi:hypothetical protein